MIIFVCICYSRGCVWVENVSWRVKIASRESLEQVALYRHVCVPRECHVSINRCIYCEAVFVTPLCPRTKIVNNTCIATQVVVPVPIQCYLQAVMFSVVCCEFMSPSKGCCNPQFGNACSIGVYTLSTATVLND